MKQKYATFCTTVMKNITLQFGKKCTAIMNYDNGQYKKCYNYFINVRTYEMAIFTLNLSFNLVVQLKSCC